MAPDKQQLLHELLQEDQEPFRLKTYMADRPSRLKNPNPCTKTVNTGVVLRVPSDTAAVLVEAAARIQKQRKSRYGSKNSGFGFFASLFRSRRKRTRGKLSSKNRELRSAEEEDAGISRRLASEMEAGVSTSELNWETMNPRFCVSPFIFSSVQNSGGSSPEEVLLSSPVLHCLKHQQENENCEPKEATNEGKEQSSPVSILEPPFHDDDHRHGNNATAVIDDHYGKLQRAKYQLLCTIRRFEKLGELDAIQLEEEKLAEGELGSRKSEQNEVLRMRKLGSCKDLDSNKIEMMMIKFDEWGKYDKETVEEVTEDIEAAICGLLVQELWEEWELDSCS